MIYCTNCGTGFEGKFCPKCGTPAGAAAPPPGYSAPPPVYAPTVNTLPSNWASVLCYVVPIVGPLVFLLLAPYNQDRKIRFDAWQGLFLQIAYFVLRLIFGSLWTFSWQVFSLLSTLLGLGYLVLVIILAIKAYQNQTLVLPVIGPLAEKQK